MSKKDRRLPMNRRQFLAGTAAGGLAAASGTIVMPHIARAAAPVKVGIIHPVTGAVSYSGTQGRMGAMMAVGDINKAGGIKSLGGAKIDAILADAQSRPDIGAADVERFNEDGVSAIVGGYASFICLATTQAAAKHGIPYVVDVGTDDRI
ncbi:MAG: ABC transporter substrate-binding protein, partial [Stellaceae bacterium]